MTVESTVLHPGTIELTLRNDGPDPVEVAQVAVNDAYAPFSPEGDREIGHLGATTLKVDYPWIEGEAYEIFVLTSAGGTIDATIPVATETPETDLSFYGLMALLGIYVGVIPVSLGMLWLPFMRRLGSQWIGALIAFTVGLLAFLAIDAGLEGLEIAAEAPAAFGGVSLVFAGGLAAYLVLAAIDSWLEGRARSVAAGDAGAAPGPPVPPRQRSPPAPTWRSWSRSGSASTTSARGWRSAPPTRPAPSPSAPSSSSASRSTTPPRGWRSSRRSRGGEGEGGGARARRACSGSALIAGGPAILGAWIGASAFDPSIAALLFGVGVGAIVRVIVQIAPSMRDGHGRLLHPLSVGGMLLGIALLYVTGLLVTV